MGMENSISDHAVGQLGVALRAAIVGGVGYLAWMFVSSSAFDFVTYAGVVGVLWALTNATFWIVKMYRPHLLDTAQAVEEDL